MAKQLDFEKDMVKLPYANLMLEITRKCNLECAHCMRGEAQNIDMPDKILETVFNQVEQIYHLSLTGGEPFLAPQTIEKMVDTIIENNIYLWRCTTVENGTILDNRGIRCINALNRLGEYIYNSVWNEKTKKNLDEKPPVTVSVSNSKYHNNNTRKALSFYKLYANQYLAIDDQGEWETGLKDKQGNPLKNKDIKGNGKIWLKKQGRAENFLNAKYTSHLYRVDFWLNKDENKACVNTSVEICSNGNVIPAEPLSFKTMDSKNMGNVLNEPISCMIYRWNWNQPLDKTEVMQYCNNMELLENPKLPDKKRGELTLLNSYIDSKKTLLVAGHKDYPYLSRNDLYTAAIATLILMWCKMLKNTEPDITEEDIIELLITREFTGNYTKKFTIQDLKKIVDNIVAKHNRLVIKNQGVFEYLKYRIELSLIHI